MTFNLNMPIEHTHCLSPPSGNGIVIASKIHLSLLATSDASGSRPSLAPEGKKCTDLDWNLFCAAQGSNHGFTQ